MLVLAVPAFGEAHECTRHASSQVNCLASGHHGCAWHQNGPSGNPHAGTCAAVPRCEERSAKGCTYRQTNGNGGRHDWDYSTRECYAHGGTCHNSSACINLHRDDCADVPGAACAAAWVCSHNWPLPLACGDECALTTGASSRGAPPSGAYVEMSLDETEPLFERGPLSAPSGAAAMKGAQPTAAVSFGTLTGIVDDGADAFLGIPFAEPPIGALRWQPPVDWRTAYSGGERDATVFGSTCMQSKVYTPALQMSESCLYLNVWAPPPPSRRLALRNASASASADADPRAAGGLPVLVFIHGGGCSSGSSSIQGYNGAHLASTQNVVVVTLNYRVGAFGFLSVQAQADAEETTGNWGLLDQQAALRWVQREVAHFGGDAARVMLFGESAGAMAVCAHLAMPSSAGLFKRALMQSRSCVAKTLAQGLSGSDLSGDAALRSATKCKDLACLLAKSSDEILAASASSSWLPVVDGVALRENPMATLERSGGNVAEVILGTTTEEGSVFVIPYYASTLPAKSYTSALDTLFGDGCCDRAWTSADTAQVLSMYPNAGPSGNRANLIQLKTDYLFACPARRVARAIVANGGRAYVYRFDDYVAISPTQGWGTTAYHGAELPFVFGQEYVPWTDASVSFAKKERALSDAIMASWSSFARSGSPQLASGARNRTGGGAFAWPAYTKSADKNALFTTAATTTESGYRKSFCDVWDTLPAPHK